MQKHCPNTLRLHLARALGSPDVELHPIKACRSMSVVMDVTIGPSVSKESFTNHSILGLGRNRQRGFTPSVRHHSQHRRGVGGSRQLVRNNQEIRLNRSTISVQEKGLRFASF